MKSTNHTPGMKVLLFKAYEVGPGVGGIAF
jgi:hypothetical protein